MPDYPQKLYASHWMGSGDHIYENCAPYFFRATLLPLGKEVDCARRPSGCHGTWMCMGLDDASHALVKDAAT